MKNKFFKTVLSIVILFITNSFFAQDYTFKNYNWNEKNFEIDVPEQYKNQNEVILERIEKIEIVLEKNSASQFRLLHEKTFINADDAIERNNKIYIPFSQNEKIITNKARVILKSGKVILLNEKDIKEEVDEERGTKYSYYAVNGLEKGAVIETFLIIQEQLELDGKSFTMQDQYPIVSLNFELIYPNHLIFKTKSINGLSEPVLTKINEEKTHVLAISEKNIVGIEDDEKYSNWKVNLKMFRYKLDENLLTGAKNLNNFKKYSTNLYDRLHPELEKKEQKSLDEFCESIEKSKDLQEQIWNIENKIKKTITYNKYIDGKKDLNEVFKTKQANMFDLMKLYCAVFKNFKTENQVVFTSSRFKIPFDKEFESHENLNDILFYFPSIKKYLTPTEIEYRIPLFPNDLGNNNGLFVKEKIFAGVGMGVGEINFIEIPGTEITHDYMDITIDFTKDLENPSITNKLTFGGYSAISFQPIKDYASAEQYKTMMKSVAENYTIKTEYKTLTIENDGVEFIGKKPFVLKLTFDGKDLIQKAGPNYLFSIGKIIGAQSELYQETKRILPVEIQYPHYYTRNIKVILPKGIVAKNLEKFNFNFKSDINNKTEAGFYSKFVLNENEINVENTEFYNIINYPLAKFEEYKAVINAAADFNKIVIMLSK